MRDAMTAGTTATTAPAAGMPATSTRPDAAGRAIELSPEEIELALTALRLLKSTLGREEADELAEVEALIAKLRA